jgi:hypothetical protein
MRHIHLVGDRDVANGTRLGIILTDSGKRGQSAYSQQEKKNRRLEENRLLPAQVRVSFLRAHSEISNTRLCTSAKRLDYTSGCERHVDHELILRAREREKQIRGTFSNRLLTDTRSRPQKRFLGAANVPIQTVSRFYSDTLLEQQRAYSLRRF